MYVATYLVDKAYGGSEEGGWWYDTGEPEEIDGFETKFVANEDDAYALARAWNEKLREINKDRRPISSVLSDGIYEAIVTSELPAAFPTSRPHYE